MTQKQNEKQTYEFTVKLAFPQFLIFIMVFTMVITILLYIYDQHNQTNAILNSLNKKMALSTAIHFKEDKDYSELRHRICTIKKFDYFSECHMGPPGEPGPVGPPGKQGKCTE